MLEAHGLTKRYATHTALDHLDLKVEPGDVYCLLGANGAGKTTTLSLFLGFLRATEGEARIDGLSVAAHPLETKRRLAYIPETVSLYPSLTGLENLEYFASLSGRTPSQGEMRDLLVRTGLPSEAIGRKVGKYSKGMRQRVGIALAVAKNARALLLDEPTSGLDPRACHEFAGLLRELSDDGVTILMATHDLFNAKECGTRVGILHQGRLVDAVDAGAVSASELETRFLQATSQEPASV